MAQYEIYFFGLLCHVSPNRNSPKTKSHGVLVQAKNHGAMIAIDGSAPVAINRHDIQFIPTATAIDVSADALGHLPHLSPPIIFSGTPDLTADVKVHKPHKNVLSYVFYPDSSSAKILQVADMYACQAKYSTAGVPAGDPLCLARLLVLSVEQTGPLTVDYGQGRPTPINSWALIYNSSKAPSTKDFKSYKDITDAGGICDAGENCDIDCSASVPAFGVHRKEVINYIDQLVAQKAVFDSTDLECANSHWP